MLLMKFINTRNLIAGASLGIAAFGCLEAVQANNDITQAEAVAAQPLQFPLEAPNTDPNQASKDFNGAVLLAVSGLGIYIATTRRAL